jgi:hypothetical protein
MPRHLILLLALLGLLLAPATLLADDDTPPWLDDGDDDKDDDDKKDEKDDDGGASALPAEAPASAPAAATTTPAATGGTAAPKAGGKVGLGFGVGSVNGFSLKVWPHRKHALVFHLGTPAILNAMAIHLSYRATLVEWAVPGSGVTIGFNLGPNFRARFAWFTDGLFLEMAGGLAVGASVTVANAPVEIFMEVIPSFGGGVSPANTGIGFSVDGLVGARFYIGK